LPDSELDRPGPLWPDRTPRTPRWAYPMHPTQLGLARVIESIRVQFNMRQSRFFTSTPTNSPASSDPQPLTASTSASALAPTSTSSLPPRLIPKPATPQATRTTMGDSTSSSSLLPASQQPPPPPIARSPAPPPLATPNPGPAARPAGSIGSPAAGAPRSGLVQFNNHQANSGPNGAIKRATNSIVVNICQVSDLLGLTGGRMGGRRTSGRPSQARPGAKPADERKIDRRGWS